MKEEKPPVQPYICHSIPWVDERVAFWPDEDAGEEGEEEAGVW